MLNWQAGQDLTLGRFTFEYPTARQQQAILCNHLLVLMLHFFLHLSTRL